MALFSALAQVISPTRRNSSMAAITLLLCTAIACLVSPSQAQEGTNRCKSTPKDIMGPFYVKRDYTLETKCIAFSRGSNPDCNDYEYKHEPIQIQGKVLDTNCNPVAGAIVEYWQAAPEWAGSDIKNLYSMVDATCTGFDGNKPHADENCVETNKPEHVKECEKRGHPDCIVDMNYKGYRGWQKTLSNGDYELNTVRPGIYDIRPIRHIHFKITVPSRDRSFELITQMYLPQHEPAQRYDDYIFWCEEYVIKPEQWAKEQELDMCPIRTEPEGPVGPNNAKVYLWDIVLNL